MSRCGFPDGRFGRHPWWMGSECGCRDRDHCRRDIDDRGCEDEECCGPEFGQPFPGPRRTSRSRLVTGPLEVSNEVHSIVVNVENVGRRTARNVRVRLVNQTACPAVVSQIASVVVPGFAAGTIPRRCTGRVVFVATPPAVFPGMAEIAICGRSGAHLRASVQGFESTTPGTDDIEFQVLAANMLPDEARLCALAAPII